MKLASIRSPQAVSPRDGSLIVVDRSGQRGQSVEAYPTLLNALDEWDNAEPVLQEISQRLNDNPSFGAVDLSQVEFLAPLPRTWAMLDASAFIHHILRVRKARGAEPPENLYEIPLMYQGLSDDLLGPREPIALQNEEYGYDFEAELAVITTQVPLGAQAKEAEQHIKLFMLMNDVSLRNLIPRELKTGFGFLHGKPSSSFAPFAVTPDELGESWRDGRVHLPVESWLNGERFGSPNAGEMHFSFGELIQHAALTRQLTAGTILASGTVSNEDSQIGSGCLAEKRTIEKIETGQITTPFLKVGDRVEMEVFSDEVSVFGRINQSVIAQ